MSLPLPSASERWGQSTASLSLGLGSGMAQSPAGRYCFGSVTLRDAIKTCRKTGQESIPCFSRMRMGPRWQTSYTSFLGLLDGLLDGGVVRRPLSLFGADTECSTASGVSRGDGGKLRSVSHLSPDSLCLTTGLFEFV